MYAYNPSDPKNATTRTRGLHALVYVPHVGHVHALERFDAAGWTFVVVSALGWARTEAPANLWHLRAFRKLYEQVPADFMTFFLQDDSDLAEFPQNMHAAHVARSVGEVMRASVRPAFLPLGHRSEDSSPRQVRRTAP